MEEKKLYQLIGLGIGLFWSVIGFSACPSGWTAVNGQDNQCSRTAYHRYPPCPIPKITNYKINTPVRTHFQCQYTAEKISVNATPK